MTIKGLCLTALAALFMFFTVSVLATQTAPDIVPSLYTFDLSNDFSGIPDAGNTNYQIGMYATEISDYSFGKMQANMPFVYVERSWTDVNCSDIRPQMEPFPLSVIPIETARLSNFTAPDA